jgi:Trypsin-like peptidase domain
MKAGRDRLAEALRNATVALSGPSGLEGTGFLIAPRLVLTCAHVITGGSGRLPDFVTASAPAWPSGLKLAVRADGFRPAAAGGPDLALLEAADDLPGIPALIAGQVDPGDELWAFGYPKGKYRGGEPVVYRYEGPSQTADGTVLLRATQGTTWPGHSGSPVLSWRTGAICGVVRLGSTLDGAPRVRLISSRAIIAAFPWLGHLTRPGRRISVTGWISWTTGSCVRRASGTPGRACAGTCRPHGPRRESTRTC